MSLTSVNASDLEQDAPNNSSLSLNLWGHFNQIIKGTGLIGVSAIVYFGFTRWFSGQSAVSEQPDTLSQTLVATNNAQRWQIPTTSRAPKLALESFDSLSLAYRQKSSSVTTVQANLSHRNLRQTQADDYVYRPIGSTFRVDSTHPNAVTPSVVSLTNGDFVVIWRGTDNYIENSFAQRYDVNFNPLGAVFKINSYTNNNPYSQYNSPTIASLSDGGFVVAYTVLDTDEEGYVHYNIYARLYGANGQAQGTEFKVNDDEGGGPALAALAGGWFAVAWKTNGSVDQIRVRLFDANGSPQGSSLLANTFSNVGAHNPAIVGLPNGGFMVAWEGAGYYSDCLFRDSRIAARIYDVNANPVGNEFRVNTDLGCEQGGDYANIYVKIKGLRNGGFVVTWGGMTGRYINPYSEQYDIYARRYDANANPLGAQFKVNTYTPNQQLYPAISSLPNDDFVIVWCSTDADSHATSIRAQRYDLNGNARDSELTVSNYVNQNELGIAGLENGNFIVVWIGLGAQYGGVYAQRYRQNTAPILVTNQLSLCQSQKVVLSSAQLSASDAENDTLAYTISNVQYGQFELINRPGVGITPNFTQQQLTDGKICFVHDGSIDAPSYYVSVSDGQLSTTASPATITFATPSCIAEPSAVSSWQRSDEQGALSTSSSVASSAVLASAMQSVPHLSTSKQVESHSSNLSEKSLFSASTSFPTVDTSFPSKPLTSSAEPDSRLSVSTAQSGALSTQNAVSSYSLQFQQMPIIIRAGQAVVLTAQHISAAGRALPEAIVYTIQELQHARFEDITNTLLVVSQFNQAQVDAGQIRLVHDGSKHTPICRFSISDGQQTLTDLSLTVQLAAALKLLNNRLTIQSGQTLTLTTENLLAEGGEASSLVFIIKDITHGYFQLKTESGIALFQFSQQLLQDEQVQFVHDGSKESPRYEVVVKDGQSETEPAAAQINFINLASKKQKMLIIGLSAGLGGAGAVVGVGVAVTTLGLFAYKCSKTASVKGSKEETPNPSYMDMIGNSYIDATDTSLPTEMMEFTSGLNV